jgi:hypothetical protein
MSDRLRSAFVAILDLLQPDLLYARVWNYRVIALHGIAGPPTPPILIDAISLDPRMPNINSITLWPGPCGCVAVPAIGSQVRLGFIAADPKQPMIVGLDPVSPPTLVYLGEVPGSGVSRLGDTVTISIAQWNAALPTNSGGGVTITNPMLATITTSSAKVLSP